MASRSNRWKKNKLLANFLKGKAKQRKRFGYKLNTSKKPTFSLFPGAQIARDTTVQNPPIDSHDELEFEGTSFDLNRDWSDEDSRLSSGRHEESSESRQQSRSHERMKTKQLEAWSIVQADLIHCYTVSMGIEGGQLCMDCSKRAEYRCRDCSSNAFYCVDCCVALHRYNNILHFPEKWINGRYILAPLENVVIPLTHECPTSYRERITVISSQGQHHGLHVTFCGCCSMPERLFMCGLWPATPSKPKLAFTLDLMNKIHYLVLECQASLHDIANFLRVTGKPQPEDKEFYKLLTLTFPQYRCFKNAVNRSLHMVTHECPACPKEDSFDPMFMAVDANFRLCRRVKAGCLSGDNTPIIQPSLFLPQDEVDRYLQSEQGNVSYTIQSKCSDFKAGDALRSRSRYHALDETAVFGAVCRHDVPIRMLSLKHGERLAYADFLLSSMIDQSLLSRAVKLTYDIVCKLEAHWKSNPNKYQSLLVRCDVAIPIFHAYAHEATCQHRYSPRNLEGFGLVDGENIERLWSYLGKFSRMSKEMSPANRVDLLSDALSHYCFLKQSRIEKACVERYINAVKQHTLAEKEIGSILLTSGVDPDYLTQIVHHLGVEEESRLRTTNHSIGSESWRVKYVRLLEDLKDMRREHAVQRYELENGVESRWQPSMEQYREALKILNVGKQQQLKQQMLESAKERIFYLSTLTHHAGGQKQATRVSKLIQACTNKIKKLLAQYCELQSQNGDIAQVGVKDVCDLQSQFWVTEHSYPSIEPHERLPVSSQRRLLDLYCLKLRAEEEKQQVIADLIRIVQSYRDHLHLCHNTITGILKEYDTEVLPIQPIYDATDLENLNSTIVEQIHSLPPQKVGLVSALLVTFQNKHRMLCRVEEVSQLIVHAYWASDAHSVSKAKNATKNLANPVCPLSVQENDWMPLSEVEIQEPGHELNSYWDVTSDTDSDTDYDCESIASSTDEDDIMDLD